jgi:hypothetical protein
MNLNALRSTSIKERSLIFMTPDTDMPRPLAEALFHIHDMSTPEGMDKLQDAAERRCLDLGLNGDAHPAGVAVRL